MEPATIYAILKSFELAHTNTDFDAQKIFIRMQRNVMQCIDGDSADKDGLEKMSVDEAF